MLLLSCQVISAQSEIDTPPQTFSTIVSKEVFGPSDIGNTSELYAVAVDGDGRVFAAAPLEEAIFCFDGHSWRKLPTEVNVLDLVTDAQGTVWCIAEGLIFELKLDDQGKLQKTDRRLELSDQAGTCYGFPTPGGIVFQDNNTVIKLIDGKFTTQRYNSEYTIAYASDDLVLAFGENRDGLYQLAENQANPVKGLESEGIEMVARVDGKIILSLTSGEVVQVVDGEARLFSKELQDKLDGGDLYDITPSWKSSIFFSGTNGFIECTLDGKVTRHLNASNGLPGDFVSRVALAADEAGAWVIINDSLVFLREHDVASATELREDDFGYTLIHDAGDEWLILSDAQNFFVDKDDHTNLRLLNSLGVDAVINGVRGKGSLLGLATSQGLFATNANNELLQISNCPFFSLASITEDRIVAINDRLQLVFFDRISADEWEPTVGPTMPFEIHTIEPIESGTSQQRFLVLGSNTERLAYLDVDCDKKTAQILPIQPNGLRHSKRLYSYDKTNRNTPPLIFTTFGLAGIETRDGQHYLRIEDSPVSRAVREILQSDDTQALFQIGENQFVAGYQSSFEILSWRNERLEIDGIWPISDAIVGGMVLDRDKNQLLVISENALVSLDLSHPTPPPKHKTPILKIAGSTPTGKPTEISQMLPPSSSVKAKFSSPFSEYPSSAVKFQYRLLGHDDVWSPWGGDHQKEYTDLKGGQYTFQLRSRYRNIRSPIQASEFAVDTLWYKTTLSKILFACLFLGTLGAAVGFWSLLIRLRHQRMEQLVSERTSELYEKNLLISEQAKEIQRKTQEAESERLASLNRMLGGIAHDFNNLLQTISLNGELLFEFPDDSKRIAELIQSAVSTGHGLSTKLQTLSDRIPTTHELLDLNAVIHEMTSLIETPAIDGASVTTNLATESLPTLGDVSEIQRVVLNLVSNAKEAATSFVIAKTGSDYFRQDALNLARFSGTKPTPGDYVWLEVLDDGNGISDEDAKKLFDPFFSTKSLGRGLGLAIVMGAVSRHNGMIFLSTDHVNGSKTTNFKVCFPKSDRTNVIKRPAQKSIAPSNSMLRVLVVDDDVALRKSLSVALKLLKFDVTVCESGYQALELIEGGFDFEVALVDQVMPGMRGEELVRALTSLGKEMQIFLMSGYSDEEFDKGLLSQPNVRFLQKPFSVRDLAKTFGQTIS